MKSAEDAESLSFSVSLGLDNKERCAQAKQFFLYIFVEGLWSGNNGGGWDGASSASSSLWRIVFWRIWTIEAVAGKTKKNAWIKSSFTPVSTLIVSRLIITSSS